MEHQFFIDRLSAYFDNELKNEELVIVKEHIDSCDECQRRLVELEKLENLFAENSELSESDYWEKSAQKIEAAIGSKESAEIIPIKKSKFSVSLWWKLAGMAASLVLVTLFAFDQKENGIEIFNHNEEDKPIEEKLDFYESGIPETPVQDDQPVDNIGDIKEDIVLTSPEQNQPAEKPSQTIAPMKKTKSKKQVANKPQPVMQEKEIGKAQRSQPTIAESAEEKMTTEPASEKLRIMEFQNGGVTVAVSDNLIKLDQVPNALSDVSIAEDDELATAGETLSKNNIDASQLNKLQNDTDSKVELKYWRRKVAENGELIKARKNKSIEYSKTTKSAESKRSKSTNTIDVEFTFKQIFEGYYHIAILTNDSLEEKQAVEFLTKYADSLTGKYSSNALHYLQLYKNKKIQKENAQGRKE